MAAAVGMLWTHTTQVRSVCRSVWNIYHILSSVCTILLPCWLLPACKVASHISRTPITAVPFATVSPSLNFMPAFGVMLLCRLLVPQP